MRLLHRSALLMLGLCFVLACTLIISDVMPRDSCPSRLRSNNSKSRVYPAVTSCSPVTNYFLLKTHKCASTSVQNIMYRFAWRHNLSVMLPAAGNFYTAVGWPLRPRAEHVIPHPHAQRFDVLANHIVYDPRFVTDFLGPGVTRIGLVREPLSQFVSLVNKFGLRRWLRMPIDQYLRETSPVNWIKSGYPSQGPLPLLNFISVQFGLLDSDLKDNDSIAVFLDRTARDFSLVLVREHMVESLVVLKNMMCWSYTDVVIFRLNKSNKPEQNISEEAAASADRKENHRKLSHVDYLLYDRFNKTLWEKVSKIPDFSQQRENLTRINLQIAEYCDLHNKTIKLRLDDLDEPSPTYIDSKFCEMATTSDVDFNSHFLTRQYPEYSTNRFGSECCKL